MRYELTGVGVILLISALILRGSGFDPEKTSSNIPVPSQTTGQHDIPTSVDQIYALYDRPTRPDIRKRVSDPLHMEGPKFDRPVVKRPLFDLPAPNVEFRQFAEHQTCHLTRVPPKFPEVFLQGSYSGYCRVSFTFGELGQTENISIRVCTDESLKGVTREAVQKWRLQSNCQREGVESQLIRFELEDDNEKRLPLPPGF